MRALRSPEGVVRFRVRRSAASRSAVTLRFSPALVAKRRRRLRLQGLRPFDGFDSAHRRQAQGRPRPTGEEVYPERPFAKGRPRVTQQMQSYPTMQRIAGEKCRFGCLAGWPPVSSASRWGSSSAGRAHPSHG
jgi:hypothetical protein